MDSDPWTTSGSAPTVCACQVCWWVTYKRKNIWRTWHDTTGLRGQSMASLLIERYQPLKALSSSLWIPSACLSVSVCLSLKVTSNPWPAQSFLSTSMSNAVIQMDGSQFYTEFNFYQTIWSMSVMSALWELWVFSSLKINIRSFKCSRSEWQMHQQSHP